MLESEIEDVYKEYFTKVKRYLIKRLNCSAVDAEEYAQQAFATMLEKRETIQIDHAVPWLCTVGIHCHITRHRRQRHHEQPLLHKDGKPLDVPYIRKTSEPEDLPIELLPRIKSLLQTLTPKYSEVIALRFMGEMPMEEIAERLQTDRSTVSRRINAGLSMIRAALHIPEPKKTSYLIHEPSQRFKRRYNSDPELRERVKRNQQSSARKRALDALITLDESLKKLPKSVSNPFIQPKRNTM